MRSLTDIHPQTTVHTPSCRRTVAANRPTTLITASHGLLFPASPTQNKFSRARTRQRTRRALTLLHKGTSLIGTSHIFPRRPLPRNSDPAQPENRTAYTSRARLCTPQLLCGLPRTSSLPGRRTRSRCSTEVSPAHRASSAAHPARRTPGAGTLSPPVHQLAVRGLEQEAAAGTPRKLPRQANLYVHVRVHLSLRLLFKLPAPEHLCRGRAIGNTDRLRRQ